MKLNTTELHQNKQTRIISTEEALQEATPFLSEAELAALSTTNNSMMLTDSKELTKQD